IRSSWGGRVSTVALTPLSARSAGRLVRAVLPGADIATVARLIERSDGNPFHLEELIRAAHQKRGDELPQTVLAMMQTRLGGFDESARRVLRAASVFGRSFHLEGVGALSGFAALEVRGLLDRLVEGELVVRAGDDGPDSAPLFAFRHALVREAAYA